MPDRNQPRHPQDRHQPPAVEQQIPNDIHRLADAAEDVAEKLEPLSRPTFSVSLARDQDAPKLAPSRILSHVISRASENLRFEEYRRFIDTVLFDPTKGEVEVPYEEPTRRRRALASIDAYQLLKASTQFWLMQQAAVLDIKRFVPIPEDTATGAASTGAPSVTAWRDLSDTELRDLRIAYYKNLKADAATGAFGVLPYFSRIIDNLGLVRSKDPTTVGPFFYGILPPRVTGPLGIELIWSYWMEEAGLVQTMAVISHRFQNRRSPYARDPLTNFATDPLRILSSILWGYVRDEPARLSVVQRAYAYTQEYGFPLRGLAVPAIEAVDVRRRFVSAFHDLLSTTHRFYRDVDDHMIAADPFPVLNALKDVQLQLAEGMHNQYGDLTWTARVEMLIMQWILAQPEVREFLQTRPMLPYTEGWMGPVDAMNRLQSWNDASVMQFADLANLGEQILISIRLGDWTAATREDAGAWAIDFRDAISRYVHAYRSVTGVDLTVEPVTVAGIGEPAVRDSDPRYRVPADLLRTGLPQRQTVAGLSGPVMTGIAPGSVAIPISAPTSVPRLPGPGR